MTPDEARATLAEAGFYCVWNGRQLRGGSEYVAALPQGYIRGILFTLTIEAVDQSTVAVTDFSGVTEELPGGATPLDVTVSRLLHYLTDKLGFSRETNISTWAAMQAGQQYPLAASETELISQMFLPLEARLSAEERARAGVQDVTWPLGLTEEQIVSRYRALFAPQQLLPPTWKGDALPTKPVMHTGREVPPEASPGPYAGRAKSFGSGPNLDAFIWKEIELFENWPSRLRPVKEDWKGLAKKNEMPVVLFVSAVRQLYAEVPEWGTLIVFSSEPVDGNVTAALCLTREDPVINIKPEWLQKLLADPPMPPALEVGRMR